MTTPISYTTTRPIGISSLREAEKSCSSDLAAASGGQSEVLQRQFVWCRQIAQNLWSSCRDRQLNQSKPPISLGRLNHCKVHVCVVWDETYEIQIVKMGLARKSERPSLRLYEVEFTAKAGISTIKGARRVWGGTLVAGKRWARFRIRGGGYHVLTCHKLPRWDGPVLKLRRE